MFENEEKLGFLYIEEKNEFRNMMDSINEIYDRLQDDESRQIFMNRVCYAMTGDKKYMKEMIEITDFSVDFFARLNKAFADGKRVHIYGAGYRGKRLFDMYPEKDWAFFIDKNKAGSEYHGLKILDIKDVDSNNAFVVVTNHNGTKEIVADLKNVGIDESSILTFFEYDELEADKMYFDEKAIMSHCRDFRNGIFVDAGACDGFNTMTYRKRYFDNDKDVKAIVFEPDLNNYEICCENLSGLENVQVYNRGVGESESELRFNSNKRDISSFDNEGDEVVRISAIDSVLDGRAASFIKMDIEGSEMSAINGAQNTIKNDSPILAISIYHKCSDIYMIPKRIMELNDKYVFYLRHYTLSNGDTILYAIQKD